MQGRGLNSIKWRFALASVVLTFSVGFVRDLFIAGATAPHWLNTWTLVLVSLAVSAITFAMAARLTGSIRSLQRSTEAVARGDFDSPVEVDCECEVGGLATSFRQMTARLNANILRMNTLAYTDPITSLPNRSVIDHLLGYALAPQRETPFKAAIVFIDLDGFKRINDTLGHDGGDELLRQAGLRILERGLGRTLATIDSCMDRFGNPCDRSPEDVVFARFAGDEFVAILPGLTDRQVLAGVGESVIESLREPFRIKNQEVSVGASIGIAITPDDASSAAELLTFADLAMYTSKQAGKSRFMFFDKRIRQSIVDRARIEADLRLGLNRGELLLHFQPKVDTRTLKLCGVEALVRWQHPQRGLLPPSAFIDVAEQVGLMTQLGTRVFELAVHQCRAWLDMGISRSVAVNVSPSQFADPAFVDGILAALRGGAVPPHLISIEITESMAMTHFDTTVQRLTILREAGIRVAVDDFGIGFSNLSQLSRLPLDELKIDRSLILDIGRSQKSEAIIRAIIGMTHALGYKTIAEGIETQQQLAFMTELGCSYLQGYLFGKPMAAQQFEQWNVARTADLQPQPTAALATSGAE